MTLIVSIFEQMSLNDQALFNYNVTYSNSSLLTEYHKLICKMNIDVIKAEPTQFHRLLAKIAEESHLL